MAKALNNASPPEHSERATGGITKGMLFLSDPTLIYYAMAGAREQNDDAAIGMFFDMYRGEILLALLSVAKAIGTGPFRWDSRPTRGRPKGDPLHSIDCRRAFRVWEVARKIQQVSGSSNLPSMRDLILATRTLERQLEDQKGYLFGPGVSDTRAEQSVSRGKGELQIDADWQSEICEKFLME